MSKFEFYVLLVAIAVAAVIGIAGRIDHDRFAAATARGAALQQRISVLEGELYTAKRDVASARTAADAYRRQAGEATIQPSICEALSDICRVPASHQ